MEIKRYVPLLISYFLIGSYIWFPCYWYISVRLMFTRMLSYLVSFTLRTWRSWRYMFYVGLHQYYICLLYMYRINPHWSFSNYAYTCIYCIFICMHIFRGEQILYIYCACSRSMLFTYYLYRIFALELAYEYMTLVMLMNTQQTYPYLSYATGWSSSEGWQPICWD